MSPVHYRPAYEDRGVVCGATPLSLDFTRAFGAVTCFACRKHPTFRLDQLGAPPTDVRPSVPRSPRATIRQIGQVIAEWQHNARSDAETLGIIMEIIDPQEGPDHGQGEG